ncbi:MAG: hypothetical protein AB7F40_04735 [Victivallaceae bacterium]|nr:hypothetical protein [Victivallaceae bacterium]
MRDDELEQLSQLDARGFLLRPGETSEEFAGRRARIEEWNRDFDRKLAKGKVEFAPGLFADERLRIPQEIYGEAADVTDRWYGFRLDWAPGFYLNERLGFLWGGCAWSDDRTGESLLIVRKAFRNRAKWFVYGRTELLAHELCHTAHQTVEPDSPLEEFFAYRTGESRLRRYLGNCFLREVDALLFMLPSLLLLAAQLLVVLGGVDLPIWPFWCLAAAGPGWLLLRNAFWRRRYFRAKKALEDAGAVRADAVLFRMTSREMTEIGGMCPDKVKDWIDRRDDPRFAVIRRRFITEVKE